MKVLIFSVEEKSKLLGPWGPQHRTKVFKLPEHYKICGTNLCYLSSWETKYLLHSEEWVNALPYPGKHPLTWTTMVMVVFMPNKGTYVWCFFTAIFFPKRFLTLQTVTCRWSPSAPRDTAMSCCSSWGVIASGGADGMNSSSGGAEALDGDLASLQVFGLWTFCLVLFFFLVLMWGQLSHNNICCFVFECVWYIDQFFFFGAHVCVRGLYTVWVWSLYWVSICFFVWCWSLSSCFFLTFCSVFLNRLDDGVRTLTFLFNLVLLGV